VQIPTIPRGELPRPAPAFRQPPRSQLRLRFENTCGLKIKRRGGMAPVASQLLHSLVQALRAPCCEAQRSLAGDPSEVTALGIRHWITSFHCWWKQQYMQRISLC
jgi:hypothetical protein